MAGDSEKVLEWWLRGFDLRDVNAAMYRMPEFDFVRDDPRVRSRIAQAGI